MKTLMKVIFSSLTSIGIFYGLFFVLNKVGSDYWWCMPTDILLIGVFLGTICIIWGLLFNETD